MKAKSKAKSRNAKNPGKKRKQAARRHAPRATGAWLRPPSTLAPDENVDTSVSTERLSDESLEETPRTRRTISGSGDLTGLSSSAVSSYESAAELIEEGQGREGELLEVVENARDADQGSVKPHRQPRNPPPAYRNRHRI